MLHDLRTTLHSVLSDSKSSGMTQYAHGHHDHAGLPLDTGHVKYDQYTGPM